MKKKLLLLLAASVAFTTIAAEDNLGLFDKKYGTISGHLQSLSIYRDFDTAGSEYSTSIGLLLGYDSPEVAGFKVAGAYNGVGLLESQDESTAVNPGETLVGNGRVDVFNELYGQFNFDVIGVSNTTVLTGRRIHSNEIFTPNPIRQKSRAIEGISAKSEFIENLRVAGGYTWKLSNIVGVEAAPVSWRYRDYGEVFGAGRNTRGIFWGEANYSGVTNLEVAVFNAYAFDVVNMTGVRATFNLTDTTAFGTLYRHESPVGRSTTSNADCFSLYAIQKVGDVTFQGGYFGVFGDNLRFSQLTTGINHALDKSLMIYPGMYNDQAKTFYLNAKTKIHKTVLYSLFHATWNDVAPFDGQELDFVVSHPFTDQLKVALKGGIGSRQYDNGTHRTATDGRLFVTYTF